MFNFIDLTDKRIIVTGASQGIGQGISVLLSKLGAHLVLLARNEDNLKKTLNMLEGDGHSYYICDIGNLDSIDKCLADIVEAQGPLDGMVYCAGVANSRPLNLYKPDMVSNILKINLQGFIEFVRCITKKKRYNLGMRIVGVSSVAAFHGDKTHTVYSASKAGMDGAVRCMAKELADKGIKINTVAPGFIDTPMNAAYIEKNGIEAVNKILERQYLGVGKVEDVANAVAFLISPAASFITGICMPVDGGATSN